MKVIINTTENVERLQPLAEEWLAESNCKDFGIDTDVDKHLWELDSMTKRTDADVLLLMNEELIVGYMGIECIENPFGDQIIANEHYWFVVKHARGHGSLRLLWAAKEWAKEKGCSHLIANASYMASDLHDRTCELYERMGMKKFETSYIKEIT